MEEDIKILKEFIKDFEINREVVDGDVINAIENLIARYKELEEQIQRKEGIIKHLENSKAKYYEDNVRLLRKNGHIDILSDNLHYKYWDDVKNYISKSKVKTKIEELLKQGNNLSEKDRQKETEFLQGKLKAYEELLEES